MKCKTQFRKGDRVRITAATLRRWRKADRQMGYDRASEYSGKVGEVTDIQPNPSPYPPAVWVRFKGKHMGIKHTGFVPDWLEKVR